jgi:hypothetical protein
MALGIWIGAVLTTGFAAVICYGMGSNFFGILGLLISSAGVWLFRRKGFAVRQLGLALMLCGLLACGAFLLDEVTVGLFIYTVIFLAMWASVQDKSARVICFSAALVALSALFFFLEYSEYGRNGYYRPDDEGMEFFWPLGIAMFALATAFSIAVSGFVRKNVSAAAPFIESAAHGALLFVMLEAVFGFCLPDIYSIGLLVAQSLKVGLPSGIVAGCVFLALANTAPALCLSRARFKITFLSAGFSLAVIGFFSPISAAGLILMFFAKDKENIILIGFASAYLALGITFFYYNINIAFVQKSIAMMSSGAVLLALAAASGVILPTFFGYGSAVGHKANAEAGQL